MNQAVTFLTDGGDTLRELTEGLNPLAEHILDWFHITMRITVLNQMAKGVPIQHKGEEFESAVVPDLRRSFRGFFVRTRRPP